MRALSLMVTLTTAAALAAVPLPAAADPPILEIVRYIGPNDDIRVFSGNTENFLALPGASQLQVGTDIKGYQSRGYLRFDLSSLPEGVVTSATLTLTGIRAPACGPVVGEGIQVRRVTGAWAADFLHWNNKPGSTDDDAQIATKGVNSSCPVYPDSVEWPVTGIVGDWMSGTENHGLVLQSPDETTNDGSWTFTSSENFSYDPPLLAVTMDVVSAPQVREARLMPVYQEDGLTRVASLTPRIYVNATDPAGGRLAGEVEVEHDPAAPATQGTGLIWTGVSPPNVPKPTVQVPPGNLQEGWQIRWRARAHNTRAGTVSDWGSWHSGTVETLAAPEVTAHEVVPSYEEGGTTVSLGLTPELRVTVTHPFVDSLRAEFEMEYDPDSPMSGTGLIWEEYSQDDIPSGGQAVVTIPAGLVEGGLRVRWRARAIAGPYPSEWSGWQKLTLDM
ncbi:DNRLRE domain-containing protein [Herbidospora mongoliensis]|uniref:DNRLRE domain-containing protein n=1 Tax=Herbidospora mongoliensis TaxID=688067 RepID=UPI00082FFB36|nr:DNRLRE domain-containing protein [Herbidospora mongoliensis]